MLGCWCSSWTSFQAIAVATTAQIWAIHDALPPTYKNVLLLGAFAGLRAGEMSALAVDDVDWDSGVITPSVQHDDQGLKSDLSSSPIPSRWN